MKRINPSTEKPFKRGDVREDQFVFFAYTKIVKSDGFFKEIWLNPESSENIKQKDRGSKKFKYERKSDRKPPGYHTLNFYEKNLYEQLRKFAEQNWPEQDIPEALIGMELDLGPRLDFVISLAQPLQFDAKEMIRKSLSL